MRAYEQDLASGVRREGLMPAFGAFEGDESKNEAASAAIARKVCNTLTAHGAQAKWNGSHHVLKSRRSHAKPPLVLCALNCQSPQRYAAPAARLTSTA
ncbi:DUF6891 domain-containing protein [Nonomuraea sp. SYSU D8015]|uniref:DUF6891 domain-containing protein n=1 Tax=Nonomuraea sp. SYSU D8015 TaxID=2593644 RepID=UPI003FA5BBB0